MPTAVKAIVGLVSHRRGDTDTSGGALPLTAPRLPFNGSITGGRTVSYVDVSLADVKAVKAAARSEERRVGEACRLRGSPHH